MIIKHYESKQEWLNDRLGRITGTRVKNIITYRGTEKKIGFYELLAEKIGFNEITDEDPMERGNRLEPLTIERFEIETGKKVSTDLSLWVDDEYEELSVSPDGFIVETNEAVEAKSIASARHLEAYFTQEIPSEFKAQIMQYFVVNKELQTLYMAFYDPRLKNLNFFYLTIKREDCEKEIEKQRQDLIDIINEVNMYLINATI
jgi:putative phage-type endonuclease